MPKTLIVLLILFVSSEVTAQMVINSVHFDGLRRTKEVYLLQFVESVEGSELDSARLWRDKQRLANLEALSDVSFEVIQEGNGFQVRFKCEEFRTLLPIFSFGGIEENFWIQVGASEANLGGRGNKLTTYYQYYDRSSFATHLSLDRIKQSDWGMTINLIRWATLEPLYFGNSRVEYEYSNFTAGGSAIRHFNFTDKVELGGAIFTENYKKFTEGTFEGAPDEVDKQKLLGKISLVWNRLDYHFHYLEGWHNQLNIQTVQSLNNDPAFYIFFHDLKKFARIGKKGNFASRLRLGLSSNEDSPFAPFVLDSYLNIRGVGNRVDRGTGVIIMNLEYRHTLRDKEQTTIQGVVFSDTGSWRNPGGDFSDFSDSDNFVLFAGGGLRFIHKKLYNGILRIDYGLNLQNPEINGFVVGIGQYF